jgi:phosphate starvation-inducible protein PhoH and related proteins
MGKRHTAMSKKMRRRAEHEARMFGDQSNVVAFHAPHEPLRNANRIRPFHCRSEAQGHYLLALKSHQVTFATGSAGTGKTHVPVALACEMLMQGKIDRIVLSRPMKTVDDEDLGTLPGTESEKFDPYWLPVREIAGELIGFNNLDTLIKNHKFETVPMQLLRGRTFHRSFIILDEAQNTRVSTMKAFLTRIGEGSIVAINGDVRQTDIELKAGEISGLTDALERFKNVPGFTQVTFRQVDICRSGICKAAVIAYEGPDGSEEETP